MKLWQKLKSWLTGQPAKYSEEELDRDALARFADDSGHGPPQDERSRRPESAPRGGQPASRP